MRPNTAALIRSYPCQCGETHTAPVVIHGLPVLICPKADGDALRISFNTDGTPYLRTGERKPDKRKK